MDLKLPKLKIRQQLLLLVIAPLVFQIGISALLYSELSKVNNNLADLVYRRRILAVLDDLQRAHIESAYTAFFYSMVKTPVLSNRYLWASQQVVKKKQELADLTRNHSEYQRDTELLLRRIDECNHGVYLLMNRDAADFFGGELDPILNAQINYQVNKWLNPMGDSFVAIRSEPVTPESFSGNAAKMRSLISFFFAACVLLTGLIAFWGSRSIILRLSKIYTHVNQVKAGHRPNSRLTGEDELAELDQAIFTSAEKLFSLRNFKEDLIQAVSHDLRAPLTSITGILTLARDNAYGKISDTAREALVKPVTRCRSLALLVNDVLDLEMAKAKKFNLKFEQFGLAELVELLQKKPQMDGIAIDFANDDLDLEFYGDLEAAGRTIMSLCLGNKSSITFSPDSQNHVVATISPALETGRDYHQNVKNSLAGKLAQSCGITISADTEQMTLVFPKSPPDMGTDTSAITALEPEITPFPVRRSRIAEAGLALVIVPAIISCSMLWMLSQMIDQSQGEIQREFRSYQILRCLNAIHASHMYSGICTIMFNLTKTAEFAEKKQAYNQMARDNLSRLQTIFQESSDQQEREMAKRLEEQLRDIIRVEQKFLTSTTADIKNNFNALPSYDDGLPTDLYSYRTRLVRQREKLLLEDRTSGLRDRKKAILILLSSIILLAVSTTIAHQLLSKILTRHLFNAINNAKRLNSTEPLNQPEKGTDELAVLDRYIFDAAQELRQLENQRLELLSLLSEELKQPILETSAGIAKVLETEGAMMPEKSVTNIQNVVLEMSRLGVLVDDLTNIEMIDKSVLQLNPADFKVNDVFAATINSLKLLADIKSIKLVPESTDLVMHADRERVLQILVNLVSNAIKFSPNQTQVTMTAERVEGGVKLCVKDEGLGISQEDQAKIFQKFERASVRQSAPSSSSTAPIPSAGLGLHICKMLVEAHGGSIEVSSKPGLGAAFSVFFPNRRVGNLPATLGE